MENIRVRFAPSPTGYLHIGNARTALFNWLFARHNGGRFILRIEDTDLDRHVAEAEEVIIQDLAWLGLDWDEGPDRGGPYGPYRQSERMAIYKEYARRLIDCGRAYYCYCTPQELEHSRQMMLSRGLSPQYDGRCLHLSEDQKRAFEQEGRRPSVRFRVLEEAVVVQDLIRGQVSFDGQTIGDFIILRSDGRAAYNFAVVVDDLLMKISHVLRGEDHLSNTPKQILIYQALGAQPPQFGHMPMILGPDRTRLSKRHGATSVSSYRQKGYLPEAIMNYLALLGWSSPDEKEILSREELIQNFTVERMSKSAAIFDLTKLNWMSGCYIRQADRKRLTKECLPFLQERGYIDRQLTDREMSRAEEIVGSLQAKMSYCAQVADLASVYFDDTPFVDQESRIWLETNESIAVMQALEEVLESFSAEELGDGHEVIKGVQDKSGQKGKKLYMPMRVALTGKMSGPELGAIFSLVGRERCLSRVKHILSLAEQLTKHE